MTVFEHFIIEVEDAGTTGLYVGGRRERESMKFPCARFGGERGTFKETIISYGC